MYIHRIRIENFRCFRLLEMRLRPGVNVVVGENNAGKTSLLAAIDKALGPTPRFSVDDFYSTDTDVAKSPLQPIRIDVELRPARVGASTGGGQPTSPNFSQAFQREAGARIDFDPATKEPLITLRTQASVSPGLAEAEVEFFSIRSNGTAQLLSRSLRAALRSYSPYYQASAFRDIVADLGKQTSFWGRIMDSAVVDSATKKKVQAGAVQLNEDVQKGAARLGDLRGRLKSIGRVIALAPDDEDVYLSAIPVELHDLLRNLQVTVKLRDAPRSFELSQHGEGIRSIAFLEVFRAFVDYVALEENHNPECSPILGVEEPEVHLHPHAHRAVALTLADVPHQLFMTTHSGTVAQSWSPYDILMLQNSGGETRATRIPEMAPSDPGRRYLEDKDENRLIRLLLTGSIDMVFGRTVLLCEGDSERLALPVFAQALGIDLGALCISIVPIGCNDYGPIMKAVSRDALSIPWVVLSDSETTTLEALADELVESKYVAQPARHAASIAGRLREDVLEPNDCFAYAGETDFEGALLAAGAAPEFKLAIEKLLGPQAFPRFVAEQTRTDAGFAAMDLAHQIGEMVRRKPIRKMKPLFALTVAQYLTNHGKDSTRIPSDARKALEKAAAFSLGTAVKV
jgi:putative ATP-dependent endonuclease of OLD family